MVKGKRDKAFDWLVNGLLIFCIFVCLFPILYVVSVSLTPYTEVIKHGGFMIIPRNISFDAYAKMLDYPGIFEGLGITVFVTLVGTFISMTLSVLIAYPISRTQLPGRRFFTMMVLFTLLFSGGTIPTYLVVQDLGLTDSVWAMILPNAVWSSNVFIMRTFFSALPEEIFESARIDGAKEFRILFSLVLPLSVPVLVTMGLFYAVSYWNDFMSAVLYITKRSLYPLQLIIREILSLAQEPLIEADIVVPSVTMQMASVVFASLPIIVVYPFLQKHFVKGVMLGAVKG